MGKISKGAKCSVVGCEEPAVRSIARQRIPSSLKVKSEGRRAYLCEKHYKEFKKLTREERRVERWRYANI
ncbi:MAG: hypothetical protein J7L83_04775 [Thaumarchaeota archaeon]|nr:hypothetical protein [Nitrososphaerota archaeon]